MNLIYLFSFAVLAILLIVSAFGCGQFITALNVGRNMTRSSTSSNNGDGSNSSNAILALLKLIVTISIVFYGYSYLSNNASHLPADAISLPTAAIAVNNKGTPSEYEASAYKINEAPSDSRRKSQADREDELFKYSTYSSRTKEKAAKPKDRNEKYFKVQIAWSSDEHAARKMAHELSGKHSDVSVYLDNNTLNLKILVGSFETKEDAVRYKNEMEPSFKGCYFVDTRRLSASYKRIY